MLTREEAIQALVEHDVRKWGEAERAASIELRSRLTHGLALNALAHLDIDHIDRRMAADARKVMTKADKASLRQGSRNNW